MTWQVNFSEKSIKALAKINQPDRLKILEFIELLLEFETPRCYGKALKDQFKDL